MSDEFVLTFDPDVNAAIVRWAELKRTYTALEEYIMDDDEFKYALLDSITEEQNLILRELKKVYDNIPNEGE